MAYNYDSDDESGMSGDLAATTKVPKAPKAPKPPKFFTVPATAPSKHCKCGALIYFVRMTPSGKDMPVDCAVEGGVRPMPAATPEQRARFALSADEGRAREGRGVSHYATCPNAAEFRRRT